MSYVSWAVGPQRPVNKAGTAKDARERLTPFACAALHLASHTLHSDSYTLNLNFAPCALALEKASEVC
jgi:hypothetical protein